MRRGKYKGIELKNRLIETTKRYVQDKVKSEVKKEIKQKLLNALDGL
jgi:hypothetical protein